MEKIIKKEIFCDNVGRCSFGLDKIDNECNLCRYKKERIIHNDIKPIYIKVTQKLNLSCYINENLELHKDCPFKKKEIDLICFACCRLRIKYETIKTEEL